MNRFLAVLLPGLLLAGCRPSSDPKVGDDLSAQRRLPTGAILDPAGRSVSVGQLPLAMALAPDGQHIAVLLNGYREQGVQIVDRRTWQVTQTMVQRAAFVGLTFAPDGKSLWSSGGNMDVVYRYRWENGSAALADSVILATKRKPDDDGTRYPAGLALSRDGQMLYVAENLADSLAVIDVASGRVVQRVATERYPYGVTVTPDGSVWVSAWGGSTVSVFRPGSTGQLDGGDRVTVGRHPSALTQNADGSRLFITSGSTDRVIVLDTRSKQIVATITDGPPDSVSEGSTPTNIALSASGTRLFIAEGDNNAAAVVDLSARTSNVTSATGRDAVIGRIPSQWYPTGVLSLGDTLVIANGKGGGTGPNKGTPQSPGPNPVGGRTSDKRLYTLGQYDGSLTVVDGANGNASELASLSQRVARANGWDANAAAQRRMGMPPIEHVIYIIRENRTYDQVLSDLPAGDGDTSLVFFPRAVTPNAHALAERFGIYDRFFVNAEVSPDGHNWSTAAYTTDYAQKTIPSHYSRPARGRSYDYEGTNRGRMVDDDVNEPSAGYLWNLAQRAGITFRNYGEFVIPEREFDPEGKGPPAFAGNKPFLRENTNGRYPGYSLRIRDQVRADAWISEMQSFAQAGTMPALEIMRLPNDHTEGAAAGRPTPRAHAADNDLALGRIVSALSRTPFWSSTAVFVVEDDAQNGADHVDSHRSVLLMISPWARGGVVHRFVNTTDVLATIEALLKLRNLSQFDHFGRPLQNVWRSSPDASPYTVLTPAVNLAETNPAGTRGATESRQLDLGDVDRADEDLFNHVLWRAIKGDGTPYPATHRLMGLELVRGH